MRKEWLSLLALVLVVAPATAQTLQGSVTEEDFRIHRPRRPMQASVAQEAPPTAPPLVGSAMQAAPAAPRPLVPLSDFAAGPKNFDIGAEAQSKEMTLAWEKWHKQLAGAIYGLWDRRARHPGRAAVRITVYKNRVIVPEILSSAGGAEFRRTLMSVFADLNGNPGLTFPAKSQREKVSFEAEYIAGTDVDPGYTWLKGDYEKVREFSR